MRHTRVLKARLIEKHCKRHYGPRHKTALTSNFGLVGLVWQVWFGRFGLAGLVWKVWFGRFGSVGFANFAYFAYSAYSVCSAYSSYSSYSAQGGIKCGNRGTGFLDSEGSHR